MAGLGAGLPGLVAVTCRHEEDACTQDDVVSSLVELAGCDAESTHEKQNHTQDRENARGPHGPCGTRRVRERKDTAVRLGCAGGMGGRHTGFRDTGPESRLLSNTREEGEGASHPPAHGPSGAHPCPNSMPLTASEAPCDLASPAPASCPSFLLSNPSKLPISCHCMFLTLTYRALLLESFSCSFALSKLLFTHQNPSQSSLVHEAFTDILRRSF